ncbi:hypothetical protein N9840_00135 [Gammaproteobacteria bacterium]|nr:hypothetical protein [Gammaproteobacteria bacterium]
MNKKRFFDNRLKYLSFIQNTDEKSKISEEIYPFIKKLPKNKTFIKILDAGTGDGTIKSNLIKSFHKYHPNTSLIITGKEISYEDLKNTLHKMSDRFIEHPNLMVTMTNVKFSEISQIGSLEKIKNKKVKAFNLILKNNNSFDFNDQITGLESFVKKYWGITIDKDGKTSYSHPCLIRIYRADYKRYLEPFIEKEDETFNYDLIIASQAYRAASNVETKVNSVIKPLIKLLNRPGKLFITHSCGNDSVEKILRIAWKNKNPFPNKAKNLIEFLKKDNLDTDYKYGFSKPKAYHFRYKKVPDETISELFGHGVDSKWENVLYAGQIPEKDINELNNKPSLVKKVKNAIMKDEIFFKNELFIINKT